MGWLTKDFECQECGLEFEETYKSSDRDQLECPNCACKELKVIILTAPAIGAFSAKNAEAQRESLMKRSAEDTQKQVDKEPERWGQQGIARRTKKIYG